MKIFDKELRTVRINFFSLSLLQALNMFLPFLVLPYLVRVLGIEQFGLLSFAQSFIMYFTLIVDYGFNITATREISINKHNNLQVSKIFFSVYFIKFVLFSIISIVYSLIVLNFSLLENHKYLYFISYLIVIGQMLFPLWYFQGIENMKMIAFLNVIIKGISTVGIFTFVNSSDDLLLVASINSLSFVFIGIIAFYIAIKKLNHIKLDYKYIKMFFLESTQVFISNFFSSLYGITNIFLLGIFTNNTLVGIYSSFEKIITALKSLYMPLYQALFPYIARKKEKKNSIKKLFFPILLSGLFLSLNCYYFSNFIITFIYSNIQLLHNISYFEYMSIIPLLASVNMLINFLYLNTMKLYKERMKIMIFAGIINLILSTLLLILNFQIEAVVISYIITEFFLLVSSFIVFNRTTNE